MAGMREAERREVAALATQIARAKTSPFPDPGTADFTEVDDKPGVYLIRTSRGLVCHAGRTLRQRSLRKRLRDHIYGKSSFVSEYLDGDGSRLRVGYRFATLAIKNERTRTLVEHLLVGQLCPEHVGTHANTGE